MEEAADGDQQAGDRGLYQCHPKGQPMACFNADDQIRLVFADQPVEDVSRHGGRMRLAELNPKLEGTLASGILRFDCPLNHTHKIRIPLGTNFWQASGQFPETLRVTPSIDCSASPSCGWHGFVTNGDVA